MVKNMVNLKLTGHLRHVVLRTGTCRGTWCWSWCVPDCGGYIRDSFTQNSNLTKSWESSLTRWVDCTMIFCAYFSWTLMERLVFALTRELQGIWSVSISYCWLHTFWEKKKTKEKKNSIHFLVSFVLVAPPSHHILNSIPSALFQNSYICCHLSVSQDSWLSVTFLCVFICNWIKKGESRG